VLPSVLRVGGVQLNVAAPVPLPPEGALATVMANPGNVALALPSLTVMAMVPLLPDTVGVPDNLPVLVLNEAQDGTFEALKVRVSPFASFAVGVKAYAVPTVAEVDGEPVIVGEVFEPLELPEAVIAKVDRALLETPSLALI
jgi:hypothetical protein